MHEKEMLWYRYCLKHCDKIIKICHRMIGIANLKRHFQKQRLARVAIYFYVRIFFFFFDRFFEREIITHPKAIDLHVSESLNDFFGFNLYIYICLTQNTFFVTLGLLCCRRRRLLKRSFRLLSPPLSHFSQFN